MNDYNNFMNEGEWNYVSKKVGKNPLKPQHKILGAQQLQAADKAPLTKTTVSHN